MRQLVNARAPVSLNTEKYPRLGQWIHSQCNAYRNEQLREAGANPGSNNQIGKAQIAQMKNIGMDWVAPSSWSHQFALLKKFVRETGHARLPFRVNSAAYPRHSEWVHAKRGAYRAEQKRAAGKETRSHVRISDARVAQLESIGFEWKVRGKPLPPPQKRPRRNKKAQRHPQDLVL